MKEFKQVRDNLLDMLEDIDERLAKIADDGATAKNITDNSFEASNEDSVSSEISNIQLAIAQIDGGTYGICLSCGQPIKKEDLSAEPLSSHCIHCSESGDGS